MESRTENEKSVLIVSYVFPPAAGVGGRRWAKFSKYLVRAGVKVTVLSALSDENSGSAWSQDVRGVDTIRMPFHYPKIISRSPNHFFDKLNYKISLALLRLFSRGNVYDKASFSERPFIRRCVEIIKKKNIRNLIITGPPFRLAYYGALIKEIKPEINLIVDFRDQWAWGDSYGYANLNKKNLLFEKNRESKVMKSADVIFVPMDSFREELVRDYPHQAGKVLTLPHGFDKEDFRNVTPSRKEMNETVKIVFGGTYYDETDQLTERIAETVRKNSSLNFEICFYTGISPNNNVLAAGNLKTHIKFLPPLPSAEYFERIAIADYFLVIFPEKFKNILSTKFFEIVYLKIPVIYIGSTGLVSEFITKNNLGKHILPENIAEEFPFFMKNKILPGYNPGFNPKGYDYFDLTKMVFDKLR